MVDVIARIHEESGKSFDPQIVDILCASCAELEARVLAQGAPLPITTAFR